jgi:hypothetical protein
MPWEFSEEYASGFCPAEVFSAFFLYLLRRKNAAAAAPSKNATGTPIPKPILALVLRSPLGNDARLVVSAMAFDVAEEEEDVIVVARVVLADVDVDADAALIMNVGLVALIPDDEPFTSSKTKRLPLVSVMLDPIPMVNSKLFFEYDIAFAVWHPQLVLTSNFGPGQEFDMIIGE